MLGGYWGTWEYRGYWRDTDGYWGYTGGNCGDTVRYLVDSGVLRGYWWLLGDIVGAGEILGDSRGTGG